MVGQVIIVYSQEFGMDYTEKKELWITEVVWNFG